MAFALSVLLLICGIGGSFFGALSQSDRCPDEWIQLNNRCFFNGTEQLMFNEAEGTLVWIDGSDTEFAEQQQPAVPPDDLFNPCAVTSDNGFPWENDDCSTQLGYLCSRDVFECALICTLDGDEL